MQMPNDRQSQGRPAPQRSAQNSPPRSVQNPAPRPAPNRRPPEYGRPMAVRPAQTPQPAGAPRGPQEQQPVQRVRSSWFTAIIMVLITIAGCVFLSIFMLQSASDLFGLNQPDKQIEVVVPPKNTLASISTLLYDKGVVSQPFTFRVYAGLKSLKDEDIKAGNYIFNSNLAYDQIIEALTWGTTQKEEVRVTFIEGWTLYEIAKELEANKVCSVDEFLDYMDKGKIDYEFMNQVPNDVLRFRRLEGYAFPDTYDFYVGEEVASVADKFLNNLNKKITVDMRDKMREMNLSFDETLILASIVQKEASIKLEMEMVASVFENRLAAPDSFPKLQSDVTIHYVEKFIKPFVDGQDQPVYDAYNTYKCDGLPVGAVCNPGLDAIDAVLNPEKSGYYYFVTDDAGTYYYAKNLQQHNANVAKAEKVGGENTHGTATMDGNQ